MSSKSTRNKRNSPRTSAKTKETGQGKINVGHVGRNTNSFDFGDAMKSTIQEEDVQRIVSVQRKSLKNFSKTNELLGKFNDFSSSKYDVLQHMFLQHTRLLVELKKDLTNVFLRIRRLKVRLQKEYPGAFEATFNLRKDLEDRLEQETPNGPTYDGEADELLVDSERKEEETRSKLDQITSEKPVEKKTNDETVHTLSATNSDVKNPGCDEGDFKAKGTLRNKKCVEQTETSDNQVINQTSESQRFSLKNSGNQDVNLKVNDLDTEISSKNENLEREMKENLNKTEDELIKSQDNLDEPNDNRNKTKGNVEKSMDNEEMTKPGHEETKGDLKGHEDNLEKTKDNQEATHEDSKDTKDSLEKTDRGGC